MARALDRVQALLFAAAAAAPIALRLASGHGDSSARAELRAPAPAPAIPRSLAALGEWPAACERWWADGFNLRGELIRWRNAGLLLGLRVSPAEEMRVGEGGWLFYGGGGAFEAWQGSPPFEPSELEAWVELLEGEIGRAHV